MNAEKGNKITYISIFLLIYTSHDTLLFGTNKSDLFEITGFVITFIVIAIWFILYLKKKTIRDIRSLLLLSVLIILSFITSLTNFDFTFKYPYECLLLIGAFSISSLIPFNKFQFVYSNIMQVFAIFSLISAALFYVSYSTVSLFPLITNSNDLNYYCLLLSVVPEKLDFFFYRNYGIFREPGMYIIFLNIAIIFELFFKENISFKRIIILILAVFTTFSTAGYIVCFFVLLLYLFKSQKTITFKGKLLYMAIFLLILYLILTNSYIHDAVFAKLFTENASYNDRVNSAGSNLNLLFDNPFNIFFGLGYLFVESSFLSLGTNTIAGAVHNTNTLFKMLSIHGVFYTTIIVYHIFSFWRNFYRPLTFYLFVLFLLMLSNEDLLMNFLLYLFVFYSLALNNNR